MHNILQAFSLKTKKKKTYMKIEKFTHIGYKEPKKEVLMCEDRILENLDERIYGVIDGATSSTGIQIEGLTDGAYIAEFFKNKVSEGGFNTYTAEAILSEINEGFGVHLEENHPDVHKLGKQGPCASGVLLKTHKNGTFSYAQIGDCMLVELTHEGGFIELTDDTRFEDDHIYLNKAAELSKATGKSILEVRSNPEVISAIQAHREMSNVSKGVITGEPEMDAFIVSGVRDLDNAKALIMMSDGMAHPEFDKEQTYIQAAQYMMEHGIEAYYKKLQEIYNADTDWHNLKHIRCKHMDDATAMIIHL